MDLRSFHRLVWLYEINITQNGSLSAKFVSDGIDRLSFDTI